MLKYSAISVLIVTLSIQLTVYGAEEVSDEETELQEFIRIMNITEEQNKRRLLRQEELFKVTNLVCAPDDAENQCRIKLVEYFNDLQSPIEIRYKIPMADQ